MILLSGNWSFQDEAIKLHDDSRIPKPPQCLVRVNTKVTKSYLHIFVCIMACFVGCPVAESGQFHRSLNRGESLKVKIPAPPAVRIGRATLAIEVKDAAASMAMQQVQGNAGPPGNADPTVPVTQLQAALDQAFHEGFTIVQSNGEAWLRVAVVHYTPAESRLETVTQKGRVPAPPKSDGSVAINPQTGQPLTVETAVAVEQWTARGQLSARVEVVDSTGVLLDAFAPQAVVRGSQVISVDGQDRVDRTQLPTTDQVRAKLIADLAAQLASRYCPPVVEAEIPLAVDDGLRPGNKLAKEGDYAAASKSWQDAALKKEEDEGDRLHNVGAVYEAQGYGTLMKQGDLAKAEPYFERAALQYRSAAEHDPKEKYITRASDRVRRAVALIAVLKELEQKRQTVLATKANPSPWPPGSASPSVIASVGGGAIVWPDPNQPVSQNAGQPPVGQTTAGQTPAPSVGNQPLPNPVPASFAPAPAQADPAAQEALTAALNDRRADAPTETAFRQFVRLRLRSNNGPAGDEVKQQLESTGPLGYGLSALQAKRVVHQEAQSWAALQPKLAVYRDSFQAFAQDGKIHPDERAALRTLAKNLTLSEADVKAIESGSKFTE